MTSSLSAIPSAAIRRAASRAHAESHQASRLSRFIDSRTGQVTGRQFARRCRRRAQKGLRGDERRLKPSCASTVGFRRAGRTRCGMGEAPPHTTSISTYESKLNIKGPVGNNLRRTYIHCTNQSYAALQASRDWVKAQQGWRWMEIATGHDAMVMAPDELAKMLTGIVQA